MGIVRNRLYRQAMILIATVWSVGAYADPPMNSEQMVGLSAKDADKKAKRDLLSILQPTGQFSKGNRQSVSGVDMRTIPYSAGKKGLCAMDQLFMGFAPTTMKPVPMEEPLAPEGLSVRHFFHASISAGYSANADPTYDRAAAIRDWRGQDCRQLQSDKSANWFEADNATVAVKAINVLLAATASIKSGKLKAQYCDYGVSNKTCEDKILESARVENIASVDHDCLSDPGSECFQIYMADGPELVVRAIVGREEIVPKDILSITAVTYVVVT